MSAFFWVCLALGIVGGILEAHNKNKSNIKIQEQQNESVNVQKNKGITILSVIFVILVVVAFMGFLNLGEESIFSDNKEYEKIAQECVEEILEDYLSSMTLVNTTSYSLDAEVRVTLKYRITEGPNTSYSNYVIAIDKDTKEIVGFSSY